MASLGLTYKLVVDAEQQGRLIPWLFSDESRIRERGFGLLLQELHNKRKISLTSNVNLAAIENLPKSDFWKIVSWLQEVIPKLHCSYREVLQLVQTLVNKAGNDGAAGAPNASLTEWFQLNPEKALQVIQATKLLDKLCITHCEFAIQGLGDAKLAFELLEHTNDTVVAAGLRSLGRLNLDDEVVSKRAVDECCKAVTGDFNQEVRASAIEAVFKIWESIGKSDPYRQQEFLEAVINANSSEELVQISAALFYHLDGLSSESIDYILTALTGEVSDAYRVLTWLDLAIHKGKIQLKLDKIIDVFTNQIPKLKEPIESNHFYNFCSLIWETPSTSAKLFSNWLTNGKLELCEFLASIVGADGNDNAEVEISKVDLPVDLTDQIFMARKCIGFLWCHEITATSILLSIVKNGKKEAREEAEKLLYDPLLLSFSGNVRNYLEKKINNASKRISDCIGRLIKSHDVYLSDLEKAKHLVEFIPTTAQRHAAAIRDRELNKVIHKQAKERSIMSQFCSHQTLLYGKKTFSVIYGEGGQKVQKIMPLSEYSYSAELPKLSFIDSVGFREMLAVFRLEEKLTQ